MMDQDQLSNLSGDIGDLSQSILVQLNGTTLSFTEKYFVGLLMRATMILNEVSEILRWRRPEHLHTVFILLRPLLDDFIQVLAIHKSEDVEEEINKIYADAHRHRFNAIKDSAEFNEKYFENKFEQFKKSEDINLEKERYLAADYSDRIFENKDEFRFKKLDPLTTIAKAMDSSEESASNINAFLIWKFLSQYIHYSNLTYDLEQDPEIRKIEILQVEEILFYCYKTVVIALKVLKEKREIDWDIENSVLKHYKSKIAEI